MHLLSHSMLTLSIKRESSEEKLIQAHSIYTEILLLSQWTENDCLRYSPLWLVKCKIKLRGSIAVQIIIKFRALNQANKNGSNLTCSAPWDSFRVPIHLICPLENSHWTSHSKINWVEQLMTLENCLCSSWPGGLRYEVKLIECCTLVVIRFIPWNCPNQFILFTPTTVLLSKNRTSYSPLLHAITDQEELK